MVAAPGEDGLHDGSGDLLGFEHEVAESRVCNELGDQRRADPCGIYEAVVIVNALLLSKQRGDWGLAWFGHWAHHIDASARKPSPRGMPRR